MISLSTRVGRLISFSLLYLTEGIPFGFSAVALAAELRSRGVSNTEIGAFTATLYTPWAFKWAWAPLIDLVQIERWGRRRAWIVGAQLSMMATLGVLMAFDFASNIALLSSVLILHNVFAATQDVAIDALAVDTLPEHERGTANGFMFGASYLGQAIGGAGALWVAGKFGFAASLPFVLTVLALIFLTVTLRLKEPAVAAAAEVRGHVAGLGQHLRSFFSELYKGFFKSGPGALIGVLFSMLPPGAVALGLALGTTMQTDLGMEKTQIAELTAYSTVVAAIGCVLGGVISDRIGHRKALTAWYVLTTVPTFYLVAQFVGQGMEGVTVPVYFGTAIAYSFASGLQFGTSAAVFMGLTNPAVAGTQFTGYMALHNLVYAYSAAWQGRAADLWGYAKTLQLDAVLAFLPLALIPFLRPRRDHPTEG